MKVCLYCRTSTHEQLEGKTIDSQIAALKEFAENNNHSIVKEILDDGISGTIAARPGLDTLIESAKNKEFEACLMVSPDRLSRDGLLQWTLRSDLDKHVQLIFLNSPSTAELSPEGQVIDKSVNAMVSELERIRILTRTMRGKRTKAKKGLVVGSIPPYGYSYVKKTDDKPGYFKIKSQEMRVVKKMFEWVREGISERGIARKLKLSGVSTRNNKPTWAKSTIHRLLTNPIYSGIRYWNRTQRTEPEKRINKYSRIKNSSTRTRPKKEWIAIEAPSLAIMSQEEFDFIQKQLTQHKVVNKRNSTFFYLLGGLLHCHCGALCYSGASHNRRRYRCSTRKHGSISAAIIEPLVWDSVKEVIANPKIVLKQARRYYARKVRGQAINPLVKELEGLGKQDKRLVEAYKTGAISLPRLKEEMGQIKLQRAALKSEIGRQEKKVSFNLLDKNIKWLCKKLGGLVEGVLTNEERRCGLRQLVKDVRVNLGSRKVAITGVFALPETPLQAPSRWEHYPHHQTTSVKFEILKPIPVFKNQYIYKGR